jgi:4'-phosphopantetheinyl transferase EntD
VIEKLLPAGVAAVEAFDDSLDGPLFPEEEALIARAVDKRRREFTTARVCARQALAELGLPPVPILPGDRGAPRWPYGVVGSVTHCDGYRAAAVARETEVVTIGIDAEPHLPLPEGVMEAVSVAAERRRDEMLRRISPRVHWDRLLFSAKESVYKAWFPLMRCWLGFEDADITLGLDGTFAARLLGRPASSAGRPLTGFAGRWQVADGFMVTAITVGSE